MLLCDVMGIISDNFSKIGLVMYLCVDMGSTSTTQLQIVLASWITHGSTVVVTNSPNLLINRILSFSGNLIKNISKNDSK